MNYNGNMVLIRKISILFISLLLLFVLISCDDLFHDVSDFLEEVSKSSEDSEPTGIFVGGDFSTTYNSIYREAFIVFDGYGNTDDGFMSNSTGVLDMFEGTTTLFYGVQDIEITEEYVYIGGNFSSNDLDNDGVVTIDTDDEYPYVQRYWLDGTFDTSYTPFSGIGSSFEINGIETLDDGTLMAGGNFDTWYTYEELIRFTSDGTAVAYSPSAFSGSNIFCLEDIFEDQLLMVGGDFSEFNSDAGLDNLAAVETTALEVFSSGDFSAMPGTTQIWDFASYDDQLFVVGVDSASTAGILYKYTYDGSSFTADTTFNDDFISNLTDSANFNALYCVDVDDSGRIYIGGSFTNQQDVSDSYHNYMMRIRTDGTIDWTFKADFDGIVYDIALQDNGKVLIGGSFSTVSTSSDTIYPYGLIRLEEYADIDYDFNYDSFPGGTVYAIAVEESD